MLHCCAMAKRPSLEDLCHFNPYLPLKLSLLNFDTKSDLDVDHCIWNTFLNILYL